MAHWLYSPFWDPQTLKKVVGLKPSGVEVETHAGPFVNELDLRLPTACLVGSAVVHQKKERKKERKSRIAAPYD